MDRFRGLRRIALGLVALSAIGLGGCTSLRDYVHNGFKVGPEYTGSQAFVSGHWIDEDDERVRPLPADLCRWWANFNDPMLVQLAETAYAQNLTVREAGFRVLEARYLQAVAEGRLLPQDQAMSGSYYRSGGGPMFWEQWNYGFDLRWELDLWGRIRRGILAADEALNASVASYDDVIVTLMGDVAQTYVQIRTLQTQIRLVKANIELQRQSLNIAERRFEAGRTSELDVAQAKSTLAQTESDVPQLEIILRQACNRLCVLLGMPPGEIEKQLGDAEIPTAPAEMIIGIPADLLRRRPDVRRAEHLAAQQAQAIGIAESDLYPAFYINGNVGYRADDSLSNLFTSNSFSGSVGPSFRWNILHYGRILNSIRYEDARFRELVVKYQATVLQANMEVENGLIAYLDSHDRSKFLNESVRNAEKAVNIVLKQYEVGTVDFNRVSLIQQNLVQQQNLAAQARGNITQGAIQTYRALGGGWEIRGNPPMIQAALAEQLPQNLDADDGLDAAMDAKPTPAERVEPPKPDDQDGANAFRRFPPAPKPDVKTAATPKELKLDDVPEPAAGSATNPSPAGTPSVPNKPQVKNISRPTAAKAETKPNEAKAETKKSEGKPAETKKAEPKTLDSKTDPAPKTNATRVDRNMADSVERSAEPRATAHPLRKPSADPVLDPVLDAPKDAEVGPRLLKVVSKREIVERRADND